MKILLVTNGNKDYEQRIIDMLEDHKTTYHVDYELKIVNESEAENEKCDFAISLVRFLDLDNTKIFDGLPIAKDTCGEKIEKDILNNMLKLKVKDVTSKK